MREYTFEPRKVCAKKVQVVLDDEDKIVRMKINGGCPGNSKAVAALAKGMSKNEFIKKVENIQCGNKGTSCADQIAHFLNITTILSYKEVND